MDCNATIQNKCDSLPEHQYNWRPYSTITIEDVIDKGGIWLILTFFMCTCRRPDGVSATEFDRAHRAHTDLQAFPGSSPTVQMKQACNA